MPLCCTWTAGKYMNKGNAYISLLCVIKRRQSTNSYALLQDTDCSLFDGLFNVTFPHVNHLKNIFYWINIKKIVGHEWFMSNISETPRLRNSETSVIKILMCIKM
jgi:hypothetical protein